MEIKPAFGYVGGVVALSHIVHHVYMSTRVLQARKKYGVKYPNLYADKENCPNDEYRHRFNCVQRGHQNCLENQPIFLALLVTAGVKHPITAAISGVVYLAGKVLYMEGYSTGDPEARLRGAPSYFGLLTLLGITIKMGVNALMGKN